MSLTGFKGWNILIQYECKIKGQNKLSTTIIYILPL